LVGEQWPGLNAVVVVECRREINGKLTDETRFYITSLLDARHRRRPDDPRPLGDRKCAAAHKRSRFTMN
jgi:hypothetical protein